MPKYILWYKKEIVAQDLSKALRNEKKARLKFHSIVEEEEPQQRQLESLIGFQVKNEYEEE